MEFSSFNKYLLSEYHVPSIFLGSRDFTRSRFPVFMRFPVQWMIEREAFPGNQWAGWCVPGNTRCPEAQRRRTPNPNLGEQRSIAEERIQSWDLENWKKGEDTLRLEKKLVCVVTWRHLHSKRRGQPPPVFLPGEFHGQRNLAGYTGHGDTKSLTRLSDLTHFLRQWCGHSRTSSRQKVVTDFLVWKGLFLWRWDEWI